jgi:hypothetical protein
MRPQFSLKRLLTAVTLIAIGLGTIVAAQPVQPGGNFGVGVCIGITLVVSGFGSLVLSPIETSVLALSILFVLWLVY